MANKWSKNVVRHLNSLKIKKYRYTHREFIVEGAKVVAEFFHAGWKPVYLFTTSKALLQQSGFQQAEFISEQDMAKISLLQTPGTVLAVFPMPVGSGEQLSAKKWVIALDGIRDPGNLGTIIRVADWFDMGPVVCSTDCADPYNPKTVQASMGSLARIQVLETDIISFFNNNPALPVYGALLQGEPYKEVIFPDTGILLVGNEGTGISDSLLPFVKVAITIPRLGQAESLNAAIATAIICSELSHR